MATLRLPRKDGFEITDLPAACMRCVAKATRTRSRMFIETIWRRQWIAVPLCEWHWYSTRLNRLLGYACPLVAFANCVFLACPLNLLPINLHNLILNNTAFVIIGSMAVSFLSSFVLDRRNIRSVKIPKAHIELDNVAQQFVDTVQLEAAFRQQFANEGAGRIGTISGGNERIVPPSDGAMHKE
jgi:hypothetical protein